MAETIGIAGAIIAAIITYLLGQRRDREAHLRETRVDACIEFAEAVMEYSAHQVSRRRDQVRGHHLSRDEEAKVDEVVRSVRSRAWAAYFRVVLLVREPEAERCRHALELTARISQNGETSDWADDDVKRAGNGVRDATEDFVNMMARRLGANR